MTFTLFLNSRGRLEQLKRFIGICASMTNHPEEVEMIITGDEDDIPTASYLSTLVNQGPFTFRPIIGERPTSLCASFNKMARMGEGRYMLVLNDDAEITTKGWDDIAWEHIRQYKERTGYKDDIIYGYTTDLSADKLAGKKYAAFPIISRQAIGVLGFFMYEQFVGLGGDSSIYRVYEAVDRVVDMSDIVIDHVYHNTLLRVMTPDRTAFEMRQNTQANPVDPFTFDISVDVTRLARFIREQNQ